MDGKKSIWILMWSQMSRQNQHNAFATSMDPDQSVHLRSLIRIRTVRLQTPLQVKKLIANSIHPDQNEKRLNFIKLQGLQVAREAFVAEIPFACSFCFHMIKFIVKISYTKCISLNKDVTIAWIRVQLRNLPDKYEDQLGMFLDPSLALL
jgi:hypothetical protein